MTQKFKDIKSKNIPRTPWAFFIYAITPHKKWAFVTVLIVVLASAIDSGSSYLFKIIVDSIEVGDLEKALFFGLLFPIVLFFVQLLYRFTGFLTANFVTRTSKTTLDVIHKYIFGHSHNYFINRFAGSLTNKIRNIVGSLETILPDLIFGHINVFVGFFVTFILIATVDWISAGLFVVLIFVLLVVNRYLAPEKARLSKIATGVGTALQGRSVDVLSNVSAVRQYAKYSYELHELENLTEKRQQAHFKSWIYTEKLLLINVVILFIFLFLMFWSLINKWGAEQISSGDFVLVASLVVQIAASLIFIGKAFNAMAKTTGELREGLEELIVDHDISDLPDAKSLVMNKGKIEWRNVDFKFDNNQVFNNFNLKIPARQRIGLVGSSGAGKSTFVSLLLRQHDLDGGNILIDEQDISKVTQDSLREAIAVVPQEPVLFHRTIKENIAYSNPETSLDEVISAAKKAQAHEFIEKLPQGYDTMVGERGVKLSGGQKQRVAIARAMLKNAPILILDEATSALDSESEVLIQKALHKLMEDKTVIAIAHRLSTLREMDRIIVLENGKIVEDGKHATLKNSGGLYTNLWNQQSGGFVSE